MKLIPLLASVVLCSSCATIQRPAHGSVDHVVLVWLKKPGNETDKQALRSAGDELRAIPGVRFINHGTALPSDRPVVDDSFDVGFVMGFDSAKDLQAYESHPLHQKKVKEVLGPLSRKIVVYDIVR